MIAVVAVVAVVTVVTVVVSNLQEKPNPIHLAIAILFLITVPVYAGSGKSELILNKIFGQVADLGSFTSKKMIMGDIFRIINISIAIFAATIASITIYQGVVQTAAQGVFMGKRGSQSSFFTILRTLSGLALVMPIYSGYSVLQYGVMSIALQSISLADNISEVILTRSSETQMSVAYDKLLNINTLQEAKKDANKATVIRNSIAGDNTKNYYAMLADVAFCAAQEQEDFSFSPRVTVTDNGMQYMLQFENTCERHDQSRFSVTIDSTQISSIARDNIISATQLTLAHLYTQALLAKSTGSIQKVQIEQVASKTVERAMRLAPSLVFPKETASSTKYIPKDWTKFPLHYTSLSMGCPFQDPDGDYVSCTPQSESLIGLSSIITVSEFRSSVFNLRTKVKNALDKAADSDSTSEVTGIISFLPHFNQLTIKERTGGVGVVFDKVNNTIDWTGEKVQQVMNAQVDEILANLQDLLFQNTLTVSARGGQVLQLWNSSSTSGASILKENTAIIEPVRAILGDTLKLWYDAFYMNVSAMVANPTLELGKLSLSLSSHMTMFMFTVARDVMSAQIKATLDTYWAMFAVKLTKYGVQTYLAAALEFQWDIMYCLLPFAPNPSGRVSVCPPTLIPVPPPVFIMINPAWVAMIGTTAIAIQALAMQYATVAGTYSFIEQTAQLHWTLISQASLSSQYQGIVIAAVSPLMVLTNVLSVWLPLLPSLTYYIAVLGWVLAVVEAMVAFPLTALGMAFPQGHDFLGSAQQSLILLLSLFIRAPLIVIGFYIGMQLISAGMAGVLLAVNSVFEPLLGANPSIESAVVLIATMMMFIYISATLISYCLSAAYRIPNMVIRWVGAQADSGSEQQSIQRIYSLLNQQQGSALSSVQQSAQSAEQGSQAIAGQMRVS